MPTPTTAGPARYEIDAARSEVRFRVRKFGGLYTVRGNFGDSVSGRLAVAEDRLSASGQVRLSALTTGRRGRARHIITVRERDRHLLKKDFFDAAHHPLIELAAGDVPVCETATEAPATITIRGVSRVLPVSVATRPHPDRNDGSLLIELGGELDRRDFGVTPSFFFDRIVVGARVRFSLSVAATPL